MAANNSQSRLRACARISRRCSVSPIRDVLADPLLGFDRANKLAAQPRSPGEQAINRNGPLKKRLTRSPLVRSLPARRAWPRDLGTCRMPTPLRTELQELIDSPNETLEAEYKSWLDLANDLEARADLARHIAALANYGGGTIVFGFTNAMLPAGGSPFPRVSIDRDSIASIVKKYLEPPFQCDVHVVRSTAGDEHPVVVVPPHGAVPICAKAGGPMVNGKPRGIAQGVHYTRKPGPESERILTAAEWAPIIRRCATHDRAAILGAIDAAIRGPGTAPQSVSDALKQWHDAANAAFLEYAKPQSRFADLEKWHWQLSYAIDRSDGQELDRSRLIWVLREVNNEVQTLTRTGWSMFYVFDPPEIRPFFQTDTNSGLGEADFLECALMRDKRPGWPREKFADTWRVSADGKATLVRNYWEDDPGTNAHFHLDLGTWFSPNMLARALGEFIRHAQGLSEQFDAPTTVTFRIEWRGLKGRIIHDPWRSWMSHWAASGDSRVATGSWPVTMLPDAWPEIVAALAAPVIRLFTTEFVLSDKWVRGQAPTWLID